MFAHFLLCIHISTKSTYPAVSYLLLCLEAKQDCEMLEGEASVLFIFIFLLPDAMLAV